MKFFKNENGMIDLSGIEYFLFAGFGAVVGLLICVFVVFPLSLIWPTVWGAAVWIIGGFTFAGLVWAALMPK